MGPKNQSSFWDRIPGKDWLNIGPSKLEDKNLTHIEAPEAIKLTINNDYTLLPTRRPLKDLKPSQNIIEFNLWIPFCQAE